MVQGVVKKYWMFLLVNRIKDDVTAIFAQDRGLGSTLARTLEAMGDCGGVGEGGDAMARGDRLFHGLEDVVTTDGMGKHYPDP